MTGILDKPEVVAATVRRYLELIAHCSADDLVQRFADDATVEDPVGSEPRIGPQAIHDFFAALGKPQPGNGTRDA
jgi:steroid Delta-isomerase